MVGIMKGAKRGMALALVALAATLLALGGCGSLSGPGAAYEDDACRVTDVALAGEAGSYAEVTATFENKTDGDDKFLAVVKLLDGSGAEIGEALVTSEDLGAGQSGPSTSGLVMADGGFINADDAALEQVAELKVESVTPKTALADYQSSGESAADPLVGYWKCLETNLAGEHHDLRNNTQAYAQFRDDGTWTLTLGDETYDFVWKLSEQSEGVPYLLSFADDQVWGGMISDEGAADMLVIGSLTDVNSNNIIFQRAE